MIKHKVKVIIITKNIEKQQQNQNICLGDTLRMLLIFSFFF